MVGLFSFYNSRWWAPASALRACLKREYQSSLKTFTGLRDRPVPRRNPLCSDTLPFYSYY
ncbi:hypothetical protein CVS40_0920 [Lucilia cuprina]|nr:hypothetical protein CVS40_0920 [Lucilia cuprina]